MIESYRPRLMARTTCRAFISSAAMLAARLSRLGSRRISSPCRRVRRSLSARQRASSWASLRRSAALMPGSRGAATGAMLLPSELRRGLLVLVLAVPVLQVRVAMASGFYTICCQSLHAKTKSHYWK